MPSRLEIRTSDTPDGVRDLIADLNSETGLAWAPAPPTAPDEMARGEMARGEMGLADVVVAAFVGASSETVVKTALDQAATVLRRWRDGHLDKPDASLRQVDGDDAAAADRDDQEQADQDRPDQDRADQDRAEHDPEHRREDDGPQADDREPEDDSS